MNSIFADLQLEFVASQFNSAIETSLEKSFHTRNKAKELIGYEVGEVINQLEAQSVEEEDVVKLISIICGGYGIDELSGYLSYHQFLEKKDQFDILGGLYDDLQKKYKNKKIEESQIKFRSLMLMIYIQDNLSKFSRVRMQQIFAKNKIVW